MRLRRRDFVLGTLAASVVGYARSAWAAAVSRGAGDPLGALAPFLDTVLPADEIGPSATDLGVDRRFHALARRRPDLHRLLELACGWLDAEARRAGAADFAALAEAERDAIVARAEGAPPGTPPRALFDTIRPDAFRLYYSDSRSWGGLGYAGPPQPEGFLDHDRPPE